MRIPHLNPPYDPEVADALAVMQPKHWHFEPLRLFRTLTLNLPLQTAMWELARFMLAPRSPSGASFDLRTRELIIDRVCARCGCEYEWGVHVGVFAAKAGITEEEAHSLAHGAGADPCWDANDRATLNFVDELHDQGSVTEPTWRVMQARFSDATLLELLALAGWYHAICYIANGAQVELEPWAPPFRKYDDYAQKEIDYADPGNAGSGLPDGAPDHGAPGPDWPPMDASGTLGTSRRTGPV